MSSNKLAVVLLNWNGKEWLKKFLPTTLKHSANADIFVIDNASTDDSVAFVKTNFPEVTVIQHNENHGFAGGYNEGLKKITHPYYCLLNSDVEVSANWTEAAMNVFERHPEVAAVQPKILDYHRPGFFEFAGAAGGFIDNLGFPYCRGRIFENLEEDRGQYDDEREIFWASGCCFFVRSKDFWQQNGFDARFFAHQEEIDLCWRLQNAGRKIYYTGLSHVFHVGGGTLHKQSPRKTYLNIRNNLMMLLKNLTVGNILWVLPFRFVLDGFAGLYFGYKDGIPHLTAVVRAHFAFYGEAGRTWSLRQKHQIKNYYNAKWLVFKNFL